MYPVFINQTNKKEVNILDHRSHVLYRVFNIGFNFIGGRFHFLPLERCKMLNKTNWKNIYISVTSMPYLGQIGGAVLGTIALVWHPSFLQERFKDKVKCTILGICPMMAICYIINNIIYKSELLILTYYENNDKNNDFKLFFDNDSKVYMNPLCVFDTFTIEIQCNEKRPDAKIKFNFGFLV